MTKTTATLLILAFGLIATQFRLEVFRRHIVALERGVDRINAENASLWRDYESRNGPTILRTTNTIPVGLLNVTNPPIFANNSNHTDMGTVYAMFDMDKDCVTNIVLTNYTGTIQAGTNFYFYHQGQFLRQEILVVEDLPVEYRYLTNDLNWTNWFYTISDGKITGRWKVDYRTNYLEKE